MPTNLITIAAINSSLKGAKTTGAEQWLADSDTRGSGRLLFRARPFGGFWIFRYAPESGKDDKIEFGRYAGDKTDANAGGAYTLPQAREKAGELSALLKNPATRHIRAHLQNLETVARAQRDAAQAELERVETETRMAGIYTLERLIGAYVDHLRLDGSTSAPKVKRMLELHVIKAHPELARRPAASIAKGDARAIIRVILDAGHARTAALVRAYAAAAFNLAAKDDGDVSAKVDLSGFKIQTNPFALVTGLPKTRRRTRNMDDKEFRCFLGRLRARKTCGAEVILSAIYAGGQRPEQMLTAPLTSWRPDKGELTLLDKKGKNGRHTPRVHLIPLAEEGRAMVGRIAKEAVEFYSSQPTKQAIKHLFRSRGAKTNPKNRFDRITLDTVSRIVTEISHAMLAAGEAELPIQGRDVRRTIENILIDCGVEKEVRSQLMSHGIAGVQDTNYIDPMRFYHKKREALRLLEQRLAAIEGGTASHVLPFARSA